MSSPLDDKTLAILRSFPNPFVDYVRPQYQDGIFEEIHVPEIMAEPREQLTKAIDFYRVPEYTSIRSLPPSRAITVFGARGAGKTHLLDAIRHRSDRKSQLIVVRKTEGFDEDVPFEEYLYQLFIQSLLEPHPTLGIRYFEALATQLTRLILLQTIRSLSATEKLFALAPSGIEWFRLLWWGGGENIIQRFNDLAEDLERPASAEDLRRLADRHQLQGTQLGDLALAHLAHCETGQDSLSVIRRELYEAMVRATLFSQTDALNEFLEADYRPANVQTSYRADVVHHLLFVLSEACAIVQLPVVFAFDNLEGLLAPQGKVSEHRAATFLEGIAQIIDHFRGFLFLVFMEQGLYNEVRKIASTFAQSRLEMGIAFPGNPPLVRVELQMPGEVAIKKLIRNRMSQIRSVLGSDQDVPEQFPFELKLTKTVGDLDLYIRGKIDFLRAEYDKLIFGNTPSSIIEKPEPEKGLDRTLLLTRLWGQKQGEADKQLQISLLSNGQGLTRGLGELLQAGLDATVPIQEIHPYVTVGDDPRYGGVALIDYGKNGKSIRVAFGFLLAGTRGMSVDLQTKFAALTDEKAHADQLVILWPTTKTGNDLVEALPGKTRDVWDQANVKERAVLKNVEAGDLRKILAFPLWKEEIRKEAPDVSDALIRSFVAEHCRSLLSLVPSIINKG